MLVGIVSDSHDHCDAALAAVETMMERGDAARRRLSAIRGPSALFVLFLALLMAGCVERTIDIRSDPPGADVYLDRAWKGRTPLTLPFHHYGVREIAVEKDGFRPRARVETISPPWFQIFPLDFVFECLCPFTLHDRRAFEFPLEKAGSGSEALDEKEREALLGRAGALRKSLDEE